MHWAVKRVKFVDLNHPYLGSSKTTYEFCLNNIWIPAGCVLKIRNCMLKISVQFLSLFPKISNSVLRTAFDILCSPASMFLQYACCVNLHHEKSFLHIKKHILSVSSVIGAIIQLYEERQIKNWDMSQWRGGMHEHHNRN